MERSDRRGLGLALAGHLALFAALTIGIAHRKPPVHVAAEPIDVQLVDAVGLRSAAPTPATEAPQEQQSPDKGPPEEAAPAPQAVPAPKPQPTPPPPAPRPEPKPVPAPPAPKPAPAPPKPAPPKPVAPTPAPEKAATKPEKAPPRKPAPAAPRLSSSDLMKDLRAEARAEGKSAGSGKGQKSTGSRLGPDFLKGIANPSAGKGANARASVTGPALNGLAAAIKRQVQPCYELGSLAGTPAMQIVTVLRLRFNRDGSVAGSPQVTEQTGVTDANRSYRQQMADLSRRAVLRCAPLKLPPDLYEGGWEEIEMGFIPGQMQ